MNRLDQLKSVVAPKLHGVAEFVASQGIAMAGSLLYGFLCVRLLPVPEYAKYVVVYGFLATLTLLMDVSFSNTLLPLIGNRVDDRQLIADYVASLRQLARWLFFIAAPVAILAYPLIVRRQHWSWGVVACMIAILLVSAWCGRIAGAYGAVLIVRRDRTVWYRVQIASSVGALTLLVAFWAVHRLNAFSALLINTAGIIFISFAYHRRAHALLDATGVCSREKRNEIVHLAAPSVPNAVFYAFQGQISLFLIVLFGHAHAVAGLGALTRLAQVYALFGQMNPLLIEPYFAKLCKDQLLRNYLLTVAAAGLFVSAVTALAYFFPQAFLWVLGPKYASLHSEVVLVIAVASAGYLYGVLSVIHNARKFVYWWSSVSTIVLTLLVQVLFVWKADLSSIRAVLTMSLATVVGWLAVCIVTGVYGFIYGPREFAAAAPAPGGDALPPVVSVSGAFLEP